MTKKFIHDFLKPLEIKQLNEDGVRHYLTPEGNRYPSVTTVLSAMSDKSGILEWRQKVGENKANQITNRAAARGTKVHALLEDYVLNKDIDLKKQMPVNTMLFNQVKTYIDKHIDVVLGSEISLYSDILKTAGKCDLVCKLGKSIAVVDFKTSTNSKREEWINNYFLQATTYALMLEERYKINVPSFSIIIAVENDNLQVFNRLTSYYKDEVNETFKSYHSKLIAD